MKEWHGMKNTIYYRLWSDIKKRCYNSNTAMYPYYGGRGIKMHEPWRESFTRFYADLLEEIGPRPKGRWSLNRKDNDKDYVPGNIEWATDITQANNKSNNHFLAVNGQSQTIAQWATQLGLSHLAIRARLRLGWTPEEALGFAEHADGRKRPPARARNSKGQFV